MVQEQLELSVFRHIPFILEKILVKVQLKSIVVEACVKKMADW